MHKFVCIGVCENHVKCFCHVFLVFVIGMDLTFLNFLNFYSSLGIDHDPPCSLCSHDLCLFPFSYVSFSHDDMAKRSHYRIMFFLDFGVSTLWTHPHPHFLLFPPQPHHSYTPHLCRSTMALSGEGHHLAVKCGHPEDPDCT